MTVYNTGASDLLHVKLSSLGSIYNQIGNSRIGKGDSGRLVWIPFVEVIVPIVDLEKGEMLITPPNGLLELNIRSDDRSKKERRELVRHTLPFFPFPILVFKFAFYYVWCFIYSRIHVAACLALFFFSPFNRVIVHFE